MGKGMSMSMAVAKAPTRRRQGRLSRLLSLSPDVRYALALALCMRLALSAVAARVLSMHPPRDTAVILVQYLGQAPLRDGLLAPWQRFDAFWYLRIAAHGYGMHDGSTAYYPLYPLLIRIVAFPLGGNTMLAALLISNLCFFGLLVALYRLVVARHVARVARAVTLLLCVSPTASFLLGAYTESLYLLLAVALFLAIGRERLLLAGVFGLLAALTRIQGAVLALPLLWTALEAWRGGRNPTRHLLAALAPSLGALLFMLYSRFVVRAGSVTSVYTRQVHQQLAPPWAILGDYWSALAAHHWQVFSYPTGNWVDALNLFLSLGMLALVLPARRVLGTGLWLYALATWVVVLCIHQSTARYMLTVFPALIALAVYLPGRRLPRLALALGAPLMLSVAGEIVLWSFVG